MPLPPKEYFTLAEVEERWNTARCDTVYYAENGLLVLSFRATRVFVEAGEIEPDDITGGYRVPTDQRWHTGLLDLHEIDCTRILKCGPAPILETRAPEHQYCSIVKPEDGVLVTPGDLVVSLEERERFEGEHGFGRNDLAAAGHLKVSNNYGQVSLGDLHFTLGPCQAQVARLLHEASQTARPWVSGKSLLAAAGANSMKLYDLFKRKRHWRQLIRSDGRGNYRLNISRDPPS
jgi:hypothetical protein